MNITFVGRRHEQRQLERALNRTEGGAITIRGPSGAGKTALAEVVLARREEAGAIVGRGKYAAGDVQQGVRPFFSAMARATEQALDKLYDPTAGTVSLVAMLGAQLPLLANAGFEPAGVALPNDTLGERFMGAHASATRLIEAALRVLRWLDGFGAPVILFIDDWGRAPPEANAMVVAALRDRTGRALTILLTERDDVVVTEPVLKLATETVALGALEPDDQALLLASALGDSEKGQTVVRWLAGSSGLPLDLIHVARALERNAAIVSEGGTWCIDPKRSPSIARHGFAAAVRTETHFLGPEAVELATALSLWGEPAPAHAIAVCLGLTEEAVRAAAAQLRMAGLAESDDVLRLAHDAIADGLSLGVDQTDLRFLAGQMAERMVRDASIGWVEVARIGLRLRLFGGLGNVAPSTWRDRFAIGAVAARHATNLVTAAEYAEAAWQLRARETGNQRDADRLIVREAALAAANRRQLEVARSRCNLLMSLAQDSSETIDAFEWTILTLRLAGDTAGAWATARAGLSRCGIGVPDRVRMFDIAAATVSWRAAALLPRFRRPDGPNDASLARLGLTASYIGWEISPLHSAYVAIRCAAYARWRELRSGFWTAADAYICASTGDYERAARLGAHAVRELEESSSRIGFAFYEAIYFGKIWRDPLMSLKAGNRLVYDLAIAEGDLIGAAYAVRNEALVAWRTESSLQDTAAILYDADARSERLGDATSRAEITLLIQLVENIAGTEPLSVPGYENLLEPPGIVVEYLALAQNWIEVHKATQAFRRRRASLDSHPGGVIWRFHENLAKLKLGEPASRKDIAFVARAARLNPADHRAKYLLLKAEKLRQRGDARSLQLFASAVEAASKGSSRLEAGIVAECATSAARAFGDVQGAQRYHDLAQSIWRDWGARAKIETQIHALPSEASRRLAEAEAKATLSERADRAKSRLLAEVGHELRTPLQGIQSMLDLAVEHPQEADLKQMREAFGSLKAVVDDLTELGALGSEMPLNKRPVDLLDLMRSEGAIAAKSAHLAGIDLKFSLPTTVTAVEVDDARVRQVVRNLISNALKYTGPGDVTVEMGIAHDAHDLVHVAITVEDSGPGISETDLPRLFEPFERAGRNDSPGLGLGLAVSRRIVERMAGQLVASNRAEGGARFEFRFSATTAVMPVELGKPRSLRILLVEDMPLIRQGLARLLSRDGHRVQEAGSVGEALSLWHDEQADLLLLDLSLPDGDGFTLLDALRSGSVPSVPAIILTAATSTDCVHKARAAGASLLRKPISRVDLRARIAEVAGGVPPLLTLECDTDDWAILSREARNEIALRGNDLVQAIEAGACRADLVQAAHRLSGLASQFEDREVAEMADCLETSCAAGHPNAAAVASLKRILRGRLLP